MHPEVAVPMDRGGLGNHTGATKERFLFYTARPVPPHSPVPPEYNLPEGHKPWSWAELDEDMAALAGMTELLHDPEAAEQAGFQSATEDEVAAAGDDGVSYKPNILGYEFDLPDGVPSRLRYSKRGETWFEVLPHRESSDRFADRT